MRFALLFYLKDSFGGAERRLTRVYNELCAEDNSIQCDIVVRGCNKDTAMKLFKQADCCVENINKIIAFESPFMCLLYLLFTRQYKLVQFFSASNYNIAVQYVCKISSKLNLYTVCGYQEACNTFPEKHMKKVRKQLSLADFVDLLNPTGIPFVSRYIKSGKLSITPGTFTDLNVFVPQKKERTIVYAAARLEPSKNPRLFIEGIYICRNDIRKAGYKVYLLGKGYEEEYLKRYIKDHDISDIVNMVGYDKTSKYLPSASVFFSLQMLENYPSQSLAEAAASGCYLIITDVGDSRKCADESFASFIKDDPEQLADALKEYLRSDDEKRKKIIQSARSYAEKNYSIEASKEYYRNLLIQAESRGKNEL